MGIIKKVVLCGLGAIGLTCANRLKNVCQLYVLADKERIEDYKINPPSLNGEIVDLNYVTPEMSEDADLIIIATKYSGLDSAIDYIKNFVKKETIIISLLNGISSEDKIAETYGQGRVLYSYFIGHSAVRVGNNVTHDGVGKIVFGSPYAESFENIRILKNFFQAAGVDYDVPRDIMYFLWLKFSLNIFSNQTSAIMNLTFGDMKKNNAFKEFAGKVVDEIQQIAEKEGIKGAENLKRDSINALNLMIDSGKTSMLQDILAGRKTEADMFSGEIIRRGKKYGIQTPYNQVLFDMIKIIEEKQSL